RSHGRIPRTTFLIGGCGEACEGAASCGLLAFVDEAMGEGEAMTTVAYFSKRYAVETGTVEHTYSWSVLRPVHPTRGGGPSLSHRTRWQTPMLAERKNS